MELRELKSCQPGTVYATGAEVQKPSDVVFCRMQRCAAVCEMGTQWDCKGAYGWTGQGYEKIKRGRTFYDFPGLGAISNLSVQLCSPGGSSCYEPVPTDDAGIACFDMPVLSGKFVGYFRLAHPDYGDWLLFPGAPLVGSFGAELDFLTRSSYVASFAASVGVELASDAGNIVAFVFDCTYANAPGIHFELHGDGAGSETPFYTIGSTPTVGRPDRTDSGGVGGFINVTPGDYFFQAKHADTDELVGCTPIRIEPNTNAVVRILPLDEDDEALCGGN
jgi:hypothetical protein